MDITKNTGFLEAPPRETDWIAGGSSLIEFKQMNHMGAWTLFLPREERQGGVYFDSMACVTFSALNCLEAQVRAHIAYQRMSREMIKELKDEGYFNEYLEFNLSDRFTAKMSGTTKQGNYFVNVWDSIRKHGVIPEGDWAWNTDQRNPVFCWDDFYSEIPQALKDKGLRFLAILEKYGWLIKYEWIPTDLAAIQTHLYQAPVQIAAPVCHGWGTDEVVKTCSLSPSHATMVEGVYRKWQSKNEYIHDFDHYKPFRKQLALDYPISYAIKGVLMPK